MRRTTDVISRLLVPGILLGSLLLLGNIQAAPSGASCCRLRSTLPNLSLIVGGQNGTWFEADQNPRLFKVNLTDAESTRLPTFNSQGTIWSGSTNGTNWLISGWGHDRYGANPPIIIYDSSLRIVYRSGVPNSSSSWYGGDIFASSYSEHGWLLSGLGSGYLSGIGGGNHMSLALFHGQNFTDLSGIVPNNQVGILYVNDWNGSLWMVGGGFQLKGLLFTFTGTTVHDLTNQISESLPTLGPITSLGWNGTDWLIGGYESLALYDGHRFMDMTGTLASAVGKQFHAVNTISWDGQDETWLLAGGYPKADVRPGSAWIAAISSNGGAKDLSPLIAPFLKLSGSSSILSATFANGLWALGGYKANGKQIAPILLVISFPAADVMDVSQAVDDTSYVIWVGFSQLTQSPTKFIPRCALTNEKSDFKACPGYEAGTIWGTDSITQHPWISGEWMAKDITLSLRMFPSRSSGWKDTFLRVPDPLTVPPFRWEFDALP